MTLPYAEVIGDPIAHSKSPLIHGFWLDRLGIAASYGKSHVRGDALAAFFTERHADPAWRGCNVTLPHKEAVAPFLDAIDPQAAALGAVNTIYRGSEGALVGTNTDVNGVADALAGHDLAGRVAVVLGTGGAAKAAFAQLAQHGCSDVRVLARSPDKALRSAAACGLAVTALPFTAATGAFAGAAAAINATQLGMAGQEAMPGFVLEEIATMAAQALVFDMVYVPLETELLMAARRLGHSTADGLTMLIGQAAVAFEKFFGQQPPREADAELRAILTA